MRQHRQRDQGRLLHVHEQLGAAHAAARLTAAGGKWSTFVIWVKNTFTLGRADTSANTSRSSTAGRMAATTTGVARAIRATSGSSTSRSGTTCTDHEAGGAGRAGDPEFEQDAGRRARPVRWGGSTLIRARRAPGSPDRVDQSTSTRSFSAGRSSAAAPRSWTGTAGASERSQRSARTRASGSLGHDQRVCRGRHIRKNTHVDKCDQPLRTSHQQAGR